MAQVTYGKDGREKREVKVKGLWQKYGKCWRFFEVTNPIHGRSDEIAIDCQTKKLVRGKASPNLVAAIVAEFDAYLDNAKVMQ